MRLTLRILFLLLGWTAVKPNQNAWAQTVCASPGKDGSTFSASPNTYYPGAGTAGAGTTTLSVGTTPRGAGPIGIGDLLLVIQMQGADINSNNGDNYGDGVAGGGANGNLTTNFTAGQYEYVVAASGVTAGSITLTTALKNTYVTSALNGTATLRTFQVVRVPQYSSLTLTGTITPAAWDGSTGGIVALDVAGTLNFNGNTINASGAGFRGGAGRVLTTPNAGNAAYVTTSNNAATDFNGQKGEGTAGTPRYINNAGVLLDRTAEGYPAGSASRGAPGNAGGGGNDNTNNSGGGGGANSGTGGRGGNSFQDNAAIGGEPGAAYTLASGTSLVLGGGGGAGSTNQGSGDLANGLSSSGSAGGGIVLVRTGTVAGTGTVLANGAAPGTGVTNDGGGGGGAGGSILVTALVPGGLANLTLNANGAAGGSNNPGSVGGASQHGPGGGGGGGIIYTNGAVNSATANGGANGVTRYGTLSLLSSAYGAADGAAGVISTGLSVANTGGISGATCSAVSGTIFSDTNYGGGLGRSYSTANTSAVASGATNNAIASVGTTVEVYTSAGAFVATTTTTAGGAYLFTGLASGASYTVRVVNSTVKSARTPGATGVVPVQTFRTTAYVGSGIGAAVADPSRVGGEAPEKQDAAANSGSQTLAALTAGTAAPQSITSVTPGTSGVDFGFNYDLVVNTNNTGQGSLRQFITNANALGNENLLAQAGSNAAGLLPAGTETSIFMIPNGTARPGLLASGSGGPASQLNASGVAVITPTAILPTITGANTSLDATTQTFNIGNTNGGTLGAGGLVGTGNTALSTVNRPEVQLVGNRTFDGVVVGATSATVRGLSLYGFDHNITVNTDITAFLIEQNVVGASATSFADPGVGVRTVNEGILLNNADNGIVRNNLAGFNGGMGVWVLGGGNGANGNLISNNEIRGNGQESRPAPEGLVFDGLELQGNSTNNIVSGNLITANYGHGIDSFDNAVGGNTVRGNTISGNGVGVLTNTGEEGSGLRIFGATNPTIILNNVLSGNNGSGVLASGSANNVTISQNSTFGNTRLGIDLISETGAPTVYNGSTGTTSNVTINDSGDGDTGGNGLLNFPVITRATLTPSGLLVQGFARPGSAIELFAADNAANGVATNVGFGQGRTYLGTFTEGSTTGVADVDNTTGTYGPGAINGLSQGTDNTSAFSFLIPLTGNFAGLAAGTTLTSTATLNNSTSEFSGNATLAALSGYVYEDVNYGGGAGRPRTASGTVGRAGATVELYSGTTLVSTTTTDANGQYTFGTTPGTYTVRVVNSTVSSSRTGYAAGLLPVQTYNGTTTAVGGANPAFTDAAANTGTQTLTALTSGTTTPQSVATITTTSAATSGPDFGYNFDTVVNTNDSGQGSLRQFVANSNALGGEATLAQSGSRVDVSGTTAALPAGKETSIFMIPSGQLTGGVAVINAASTLTLTGANTVIDGTTQTFNIGNTNTGTAANTTSTTVGVDGLLLPALQKPEVELVGTVSNTQSIFDLEGASGTVRGLAVHGSTSTTGTNAQDILVGNTTASTGYLLENLLIGAAADGTRPGTNPSGNYGIFLGPNAGAGTIQNSLVAFTGNSGIDVANGTGTAGTTQILSNFFARTGYTLVGGDGITLGDKGPAGPVNIAGNSFSLTNSSGIQFEIGSTSASTVTNNTIDNAGNLVDTGATMSNSEGSAINYLQRNGTGRGVQNDVISRNIITNTQASGIVVGYGQQNVTISQNSIYNSGTGTGGSGTGKVAIDLISSNQSVSTGNGVYGVGDGVTVNDGNNPATATADQANKGVDFPVITSAVITGGNLVVSGYSRPGAVIELFTTGSPASATNFGEGRTYLGTVTEGATTGVADTNGNTGSYSGTQPNGLNAGTDASASRFTFTIPLTGRFAGLSQSNLLSSTATLNNSTSEFSGNVQVTTPPVPNDATNASIASNVSAPVTLSPSLSGTALGTTQNVTTPTANTISYYTVASLPTSGTLYYSGTVLTSANLATTQVVNPALLSYLPTRGFSGNATFTYTATDANGLTSTTHNTAGTVTNGPATYTIPVAASADVTASLTGGTTLIPGQPTGYYTATFTNLGPNVATGVTQTVTLPTGATLSTTQRNDITALYPNAAFATTGSGTTAVTTITFASGATALTMNSGTANAYRFAFTAPTTAGSSTLAAATTTGSSEGANVAPNSASLALTTTPVVDVQATIVAASGTVAPGATATFTATFTNNSAPTAAGVVATVQLIPGLTATTLTVGGQTGTANATTITFANGAVYTIATGLITYTNITTLATGSVSSAIAFTMPANGVVTATAGLTTTTTESNLANNVLSASIAAGPQFDLATSLYGPTSVVTGAPITLNVTTTNNSGQAIAGAVQTVQLPTNLNPTTGSPGVFISNGGTYDNASGLVTFPALGSLPAGQTVANTITFLAPSAAFTPSAQVTPSTTGAGDTNTANNVAYLNGAATSTATGATLTPATTTNAATNLVATLTTTSTIVSAGTQVAYTVGATNAGPGAAASTTGRLQLLPGLNTATLLVNGAAGTLQPDGITYNFTDGTDYKTVSYNRLTGLLSYVATATSLASGASFSFPVTVTVPATVGNEGQLLATNSVSSTNPESVPADNVKATTVTVRPTADLVTTLTGPTSGVVPGQSVTYTATFTNNGPDAARTVAETVQLPANLSASTLTVGGQTGTLSGTTINFASGAAYSTLSGIVTLPALASSAPSAVQTFGLTFVAPAQSYVVSSAISSATTDATPANNAATVATAVTPTTDVALALNGPATAVIGNYVTYALTTTNNGPGTATGVAPTLQLPAGLTIQAAGTSTGYSYNSASGLLTFATISTLQAGVSAESYVTFTMPNAPGGQFSALASVSSASLDNVVTNNTAAVTTSVAQATTATDLFTSIAPTSSGYTPGSTIVYTADYKNQGPNAALNAVPTASLPTGLSATTLQVGGVTGTLSNGLITFNSGPANGATYEVATGLLTFPTIANMVNGAALSYSISFPAPASGQLLVLSTLNSSTTDSDPTNNRGSSLITVTPTFDLTTSVSGPAAALAGSQNVYTITTTNNGPSNATLVTQTVKLPAALTTSTLLVAGQTGTLSGSTISFSNTGASYDTGTGVLTFAALNSLASGLTNSVSNTITVTMPATGSLTIGDATVGTTAIVETNTTNNTATFTTTVNNMANTLSFAPVAQNIVNSLRSPEGNTANALAISPLNATDADGSIANYYVQSLPTSGTLYYNSVAISSIPSGGFTAANPALLSYQPAAGYVGTVFFTYTATDNNGVVSNTALYTIPVAQDLASAYTAYNTAKGGPNKYVTNDVLAQVIDPNKAVYTSAGTIFDGTGTLQAGAANGLLTTGTNAVLATTGPAGNTSNTLPAGVSLDPATGRIFVSNAAQLVNNPTARTYSVLVNTTDANGGITQALATFTIGAYPLPVVLTDFTAQAVRNRDALLNWHTASEKNNDHFDIERSFDGSTFAKIGQVAGHGTTSAASAYAFSDANVAAQASGPVYYRLRQVDLDGSSNFSPVRSVRFTAEAAAAPIALSLFPNPAQASTQLDLRQLPAAGTYQVVLLDATGRTVLSRTLAGGLPQPLDVQQLASGTYHVRVTGQLADGAAFKQTLRLTKE
jgi:uncharacterized repeat protein (TIGR01451 family)